MTSYSSIAKLPYPDRGDRIDGPGAFSALAARLDDITITSHASASARTAAYSGTGRTPAQGTLSHVRDTNTFEYWTGSSWSAVVSDSSPQGLIKYRQLNSSTAYPATGYVLSNNESIIPELSFSVNLVNARCYRIAWSVALIDGGPGSSTSSRGVSFRVRYNTSSTLPTIASTQLFEHRALTITDDSTQAQGATAYMTWVCPATGTYSFALGMYSFNTGGVRISGLRELTIEDLGKAKQA